MKTADISVTLIDSMGSDLSVVNAARVSFHKESALEAEEVSWDANGHKIVTPVLKGVDEKLIRYLAKHKHTSPFNHAFLSFRVKAPIYVARQLVKHKFLPWNEVSRRYVDDEPEFYFSEYRERADDKKQGSNGPHPQAYGLDRSARVFTAAALERYEYLISQNVAPEQAREVLPQNTMTEWIWSGSLGAFAGMLRLRLDEHAQYESRIVAQKVLEEIKPRFPVSIEALLEGLNESK